MNEITRLLSNAVDLVPLMKRTIALGTQPEPSADAPNPMGFSPTVNQRILPPTFPRYTKIKARDVSITFLEELVRRTKQACKVIHCANYHSALVGFEYIFSACRMQVRWISFVRSFLLNRTSSSSLVRNLVHVCCRAAYCNACISRRRIWSLVLYRSRRCYETRWNCFVRRRC